MMKKFDFAKILQTIVSIFSKAASDASYVRVEIKEKEADVVVPESKPIAPLTVESPKQQTPLEVKSLKFLICPIQGRDVENNELTSLTVKISAVLDHLGTAIDVNSSFSWGKRAKDQKVKAFNGEVGEGAKCPVEPCGYPKKGSGNFFEKGEINYIGVASDGGKSILQYDGHAGYDFAYPLMTPVIAPADGKLYKATQGKDAIYGGMWGSEANNYRLDNSFYIEHDNGFVTWFRHCAKLHDDIEKKIGNNFSEFYSVTKGRVIAYVGKVGTASIHLHFEARNDRGEIIDPYLDCLWEK